MCEDLKRVTRLTYTLGNLRPINHGLGVLKVTLLKYSLHPKGEAPSLQPPPAQLARLAKVQQGSGNLKSRARARWQGDRGRGAQIDLLQCRRGILKRNPIHAQIQASARLQNAALPQTQFRFHKSTGIPITELVNFEFIEEDRTFTRRGNVVPTAVRAESRA